MPRKTADLVRDLAARIEHRGYSCWFYERDRLSGSYLMQEHEAIRDESVSPGDFQEFARFPPGDQGDREMHQRNHESIPVLLGVPREKVGEHQPIWSIALGTTASLPLNLDGSNLDQVVSAIVASLASQQIARRDNSTPFPTAPGPAGRRPSHRQGANRWVSDGIQVKPEMLKDVIFKTPVIEEFINSDSKFFISANKGFGKTLVLRYKRALLTDCAHSACTRLQKSWESIGLFDSRGAAIP